MNQTTALSSIAAPTDASGFSVALAGINGFIQAVASDLPDPGSVSVHPQRYERIPPTAHLLFDSLDDLRNWAAYLQVPVTADDCRPGHNQIHHTASASWGPVAGKMVRFDMVYVEHLPEPHAFSPRDCDAAELS